MPLACPTTTHSLMAGIPGTRPGGLNSDDGADG